MERTRNSLKSEIMAYKPFNIQEERDKARILQFMDEPDIFRRDNETAHMTVSAWVVNRERSKVLLCYHRIYDSWSWLGGHADGEEDLLAVVLREVTEESGLKKVSPVTDDIFSLEVLAVNGHMKKGRYVSSHLHLNVTYLLVADEAETLQANPSENAAVGWFSPDEAVAASTEEWFKERIYKKLNQKVYEMKT